MRNAGHNTRRLVTVKEATIIVISREHDMQHCHNGMIPARSTFAPRLRHALTVTAETCFLRPHQPKLYTVEVKGLHG
jgi:hypothetical protein